MRNKISRAQVTSYNIKGVWEKSKKKTKWKVFNLNTLLTGLTVVFGIGRGLIDKPIYQLFASY